MNYAEQQSYLKHSRTWAVALVLVWLLVSVIPIAMVPVPIRSSVAMGCVVAAIAVSLLYTPDYLYLTVNSEKRVRWQIMIRWRIIGIALVIGTALIAGIRRERTLINLALLVFALSCLSLANFVARKRQNWSGLAHYFWFVDWTVLTILWLVGRYDPVLLAGLLALSAHLSLLLQDRRIFSRAAGMFAASCFLLLIPFAPRSIHDFVGGVAIIAASAVGTALLVHRAGKHNRRNTRSAMQELMEFTGYPAERILRLWSESDRELARNWVAAALDENDSQALAEWYREHSELYMFAISGYNLDYKRIRSNLKVLQYAQGACLDYGAGNGEIVLELARRGNPATYYDVDGVSAKFTKHRAQQQGLEVKFAHSKMALSSAVPHGGFDTVFSLDVLEHLPDLQGELAFLAGLLNHGGRFVFDIPAGSTKSHPMHLNHNPEVRKVLNGRGLREQRKWWRKLPLVKQEKYVFEKLP